MAKTPWQPKSLEGAPIVETKKRGMHSTVKNGFFNDGDLEK